MEASWGIVVFSVIVGALLGGVVHAVVDRYSAFRESQGIAIALGSEIDAILTLMRERDYKSILDKYIIPLHTSSYKATDQDLISIYIKQDYFIVYNSICPKIGLLGELSGQITRFYYLTKSLIEDINDYREMNDNVMKGMSVVLREPLLNRYLETREFLTKIESEGPQLLKRLKHYSEQYFLSCT